MLVYSGLIWLNIAAVVFEASRLWAALLSGLSHYLFGGLHVVRLLRPFRFEVFGYLWSQGASAREIVIEIGFGGLCLWVAWSTRRK